MDLQEFQKAVSEAILPVLEAVGLDPSDTSGVILLALPILATLFSLLALVRSGSSPAGKQRRLSSKIESLSVSLLDYKSKNEGTQAELFQEVVTASSRVGQLEEKIASLEASLEEHKRLLIDSAEKKKPELESSLDSFLSEPLAPEVDSSQSPDEELSLDSDELPKADLGGQSPLEASLAASDSIEESQASKESESRLSRIADSLAELKASGENLTEEIEEVTSVSSGLSKTRSGLSSKISALFSGKEELSEDSLQQLEEVLLSSDLGLQTSRFLVGKVRDSKSFQDGIGRSELVATLRTEIAEVLSSDKPIELELQPGLTVVFVVGVNGVGKTTSVGKLASKLIAQDKRVILAACDTFRAAADKQLKTWAERSGAAFESGAEGEKPSTVAYRACERAISEKYDVLIVDTAGRLHTKKNLMTELSAIKGVVEKLSPNGISETLLVVDASTGQNALQQAREFNEATELSGVVLTKLDGTPKGGVSIAIKKELDIPIRYIGVGEGIEDLKQFSVDEFVDAIMPRDLLVSVDSVSANESANGLSLSSENKDSSDMVSAHGQIRQKVKRKRART